MANDLTLARKLIRESKETLNPYLDLGNCGITKLKELPELFECTHLQTLILSEMWWDIKEDKNIRSANFRNDRYPNTISTVPFEIAFLKNLVTLVICAPYGPDKNKFFQNFEQIGNLSLIENLDLSNRRIATYNFLLSLKKLKSLCLYNNGISSTSIIAKLNNLEALDVGQNKISDISFLSKFNQLKALYLGRTSISSIHPLMSLTALEALNVSNTEISDIGALADLKNLRILSLSKCGISDITSIEKLTKLERLNLDYNEIRVIPFSIFRLNMELFVNEEIVPDGLSLMGNPLESPPMEIVKQGKKAVLEYFRLLEMEGGSENIYEAKLTLVGEGGSGKTSLQLRLLNSNAALPESEVHTRGVEITDWNISEAADKKEIVHIWDFGGQDMYFPVHRFFLTENAVYVLMASSRNKAHNFEYWIPSIYQFGGSSPILVSQTCHNGHHEPWLADLKPFLEKTEFNIVRVSRDNYFRLNLINDNEGLEEIKKAIITQIRGLTNFGKPVPPSFIKLRNALLLEMDTQPCMSFEQYIKFCSAVDQTFNNEETLNLFTSTMHELGALLWYKLNEELKHWVILKPEWAMKAVYALIDDKDIERHNGHVTTTDFERLWKDGAYKHRQHILKKMLEVFKIAFPKKHLKYDYILPARQLQIPPESKWTLSASSLRLWIKFAFMPKGIINQMSADLSALIVCDTDVWNNGAILTDTQHESECLVIENIFDKKINVVSRGKDARNLILSVLQSIKTIISDYRGVTYDLEVPCRCSVCAITEVPPTIYKYSSLLKWSAIPNKILRCNESEEEYTVDDLLRSIGLQATREDSGKKTAERPREDTNISRPLVINQKFDVNVIQENKQTATAEVKVKIDLKNSEELNSLKELVKDLKQADSDNKLWQDNLVKILLEIDALENASTKEEQKEKWIDIKKVWETMKISKDAKALAEAIPWLVLKLESLPQLFHEIGKMFN